MLLLNLENLSRTLGLGQCFHFSEKHHMIFNFFEQIKKIHSDCGFKIVLNIRHFRQVQYAGFETE